MLRHSRAWKRAVSTPLGGAVFPRGVWAEAPEASSTPTQRETVDRGRTGTSLAVGGAGARESSRQRARHQGATRNGRTAAERPPSVTPTSEAGQELQQLRLVGVAQPVERVPRRGALVAVAADRILEAEA